MLCRLVQYIFQLTKAVAAAAAPEAKEKQNNGQKSHRPKKVNKRLFKYNNNTH